MNPKDFSHPEDEAALKTLQAIPGFPQLVKKLFLVVIVLLINALAISAAGGKCGDNAVWEFDAKTGVLTISGTGPMWDFNENQKKYAPWEKKKKDIKSIIVNDGITTIGREAFYKMSLVTSISLPRTVARINDYAFHYCQNLATIALPDGVTYIGWGAFRECTILTSIEIPNSVTMMGHSVFYNCKSLTSVILSNRLNTIGSSTFMGCASLKSIDIPNQVTSIESGAFFNCKSLTSIEIPNSVRIIGESAFLECESLTSVSFSKSITTIEEETFYKCSNLKYAILPDGIKSIGHFAFTLCKNLMIVTIPKSVTKIEEYAFYDCGKDLYIYTASSCRINDVPATQIIPVSNENLTYYIPFSLYAKDYVEKSINNWQQKGEFERTADWQKRVNEQTRQQKIKDLLAEAEQKYLAFHVKKVNVNPTLGKYDADNEVFAMTDATYGTMYIAVPYDDAQDFKRNWSNKKINHQLQISDDQIKLAAITITMPNGKDYTYRNTDAVNYNLAEAEYNFDPIELNIPQSTTSAQPQGQRNITTSKIQIGKSQVDTDIPVTDASNPNTFVIIFANENYKNVASVPFAKNDGSIFQKYCQKTLGIPVTNIHYVENASYNDIRIQLAWLKDVCDAFEGKASLIVYYAGHGIPDEASKSAYLLPIDGDGRYVQSAYKIDDLYQKLGAMNAKSVTVFMDACFSGSKREEGMLASARAVAIKVKSGEPQGNMVVFSAAQEDETAYPDNEQQHGMFTYYLLKKLQETKGDVTLRDLGTYVTTNVRQQSIVKNGKTQTPTVTASHSLGSDWQNWKLK